MSLFQIAFLASLSLLTSCALWRPLFTVDDSTKEVVAESSKISEEEEVAPVEVEEVPPSHYFESEAVRPSHTRRMVDFCRKIDERFLHWGWGLSGCRQFPWHHVRDSVNGDPLMWVVFGDETKAPKDNANTTLIMCGVHGDEITPIKFCFDILHYLNDQFKSDAFKDSLVIVLPIANPDSFFIQRPTRVNARGVDINRNFPTRDWSKDALRLWRGRYRSDPRRYPGESAMSEPETLTQVNLMKRYRPQKIISVHAPLTILDYDGPVELTPHFQQVGANASELLVQMSKKAQGYKLGNFPFFPGSLGNYAGNERGIPTYTLELPSSDNRKHREYWELFKKAIRTAIVRDLMTTDSTAQINIE